MSPPTGTYVSNGENRDGARRLRCGARRPTGCEDLEQACLQTTVEAQPYSIPHERSTPAHMHPRVVIVGGGLAGMAAAVALEAAGATVTLLEARRSPRRPGRVLRRPADRREPRQLPARPARLLHQPARLLPPARRRSTASASSGPSTSSTPRQALRPDRRARPARPAAPGAGDAGFGVLTWGERLALSRAMPADAPPGPPGRLARLDDVPFGQWLDEHRQPAALVREAVRPGPHQRLERRDTGWPAQPTRSSLPGRAARPRRRLPSWGCRLPAGPALRHAALPRRAAGRARRGTDLRAAIAVTGVALQRRARTPVRRRGRAGDEPPRPGQVGAAKLLAAARRAVRRHRPASERADPRRPPLVRSAGAEPSPHAALVDGPLQWLFRKDAEGRSLHGVISAAREWVDVPKEECLRQFEAPDPAVLPAARDAKLERGVIVIEKRATFSPLPGIDRLRPPQAPPPGGIANLYLGRRLHPDRLARDDGRRRPRRVSGRRGDPDGRPARSSWTTFRSSGPPGGSGLP